jgi:hypothetical protein
MKTEMLLMLGIAGAILYFLFFQNKEAVATGGGGSYSSTNVIVPESSYNQPGQEARGIYGNYLGYKIAPKAFRGSGVTVISKALPWVGRSIPGYTGSQAHPALNTLPKASQMAINMLNIGIKTSISQGYVNPGERIRMQIANAILRGQGAI